MGHNEGKTNNMGNSLNSVSIAKFKAGGKNWEYFLKNKSDSLGGEILGNMRIKPLNNLSTKESINF